MIYCEIDGIYITRIITNMYTNPLTIEINLKQVRKGKHYVLSHVQELEVHPPPCPTVWWIDMDPVSWRQFSAYFQTLWSSSRHRKPPQISQPQLKDCRQIEWAYSPNAITLHTGKFHPQSINNKTLQV